MRISLKHIAFLLLTLTNAMPIMAQTYVKVSSKADIRENVDYLLVCEAESLVYAGYNTEHEDLDVQSVTITDGTITGSDYHRIRLEKTSKGWFIKDIADNKYIGSVKNSATLNYSSTKSSSTTYFIWIISTDQITTYSQKRHLASNESSDRKALRAYVANTNAPVTLFCNNDQAAGIEATEQNQSMAAPPDVFDLQGRKVGTSESLPTLPKGIYIIGKRKVAL